MYYEELAHTIMEAEKFQNLPPPSSTQLQLVVELQSNPEAPGEPMVVKTPPWLNPTLRLLHAVLTRCAWLKKDTQP